MTYVTAPVHDLLIRIKNAYTARKELVDGVVYSKFKATVLDLLKQYNFIIGYVVHEEDNKKTIQVTLRQVTSFVDHIPVIKFYSKPSRPWYIGYKNIKPVAGGKGIGIISTNQGLMPTHIAREKKLGGELIAEIY